MNELTCLLSTPAMRVMARFVSVPSTVVRVVALLLLLSLFPLLSTYFVAFAFSSPLPLFPCCFSRLRALLLVFRPVCVGCLCWCVVDARWPAALGARWCALSAATGAPVRVAAAHSDRRGGGASAGRRPPPVVAPKRFGDCSAGGVDGHGTTAVGRLYSGTWSPWSGQTASRLGSQTAREVAASASEKTPSRPAGRYFVSDSRVEDSGKGFVRLTAHRSPWTRSADHRGRRATQHLLIVSSATHGETLRTLQRCQQPSPPCGVLDTTSLLIRR